jgi:RHS repeat-associated protein
MSNQALTPTPPATTPAPTPNTTANKNTYTTSRTPLRFQGQYFDQESGLHYNRHRYYNPDVRRYLTPDPVKLAGGINAY